MYYYFSGKNPIKIPKFFFYELPNNNINFSGFTFFDDDNKRLAFPLNEPEINNHTNNYSKGLKNYFGNHNYNRPSYYRNVTRNIKDNNFFLTSTKIKESLDVIKNNLLPPSLNNSLGQFYEYLLTELIIKNLKSIPNIIKTDGLDEEYYNCLLIQELVKEHAINKIQIYSKNILQVIRPDIISRIPQDNLDLVLKPETYSVNFNKLNDDILKTFTDSKILLNFYKFSENQNKNDKFIIYPNDYTNTQLLTSFFCLELKEEAISNMLENFAQSNIIDKDNNTPIHSLLKNYYAKPLKKLKNEGVDFKYNDLEKLQGTPLDYMLKEYKNHVEKFSGNNTRTYDMMKFFINNQYEEINNMIKADTNYGNNIIRNLNLSFIMVEYLVDEYLTNNLLRFDDINLFIKLLIYLILS